MSSARFIVLRNVSKTYQVGRNIVHALSRISLSIRRGEFVAITGPSGAGKSTLLHIIGGLDRPSSGYISVDDKVLTGLSAFELAMFRKYHVGFVFQFFNLIPTLTVRENVLLPKMFDRNRYEARAEQLLKLVGLEARKNHRPSELSGGEQQRVAIARALINEPLILIADEPTGNLDSVTATGILELFVKINNQGRTIILGTHNPEVAKNAQRIIALKDGKVI